MDPARDLALLEIEQGSLTPIPLYAGPLDDGAPVAALGYPGNVDLATARSAEDYINAAAADPLGRHLLQRPRDQRHHHPAPHRQYRPRP